MMKNKILGLLLIALISMASATDTVITDTLINTTGQYNLQQEATSGIGGYFYRNLAAASSDSVLIKFHNDNAADDQGVFYAVSDVNATASNPLAKFETTQVDHDQSIIYIVTASDATAGASVVKIESTAATHDEEMLEIANAGSGASLYFSGTTQSIGAAATLSIAPTIDLELAPAGADVDISGADLWLDSGELISFDGSAETNYIYFSTNLQISSTTDIVLDGAGGDVDIDAADLWIDSTKHIALDGSADANYLTYNGSDIVVIAAADIHLDPAGGDVVIDGDTESTSFTIGANSLATTEWVFLDGIDQSVAQADAPTFASVQSSLFNCSGDCTIDSTSDVILDSASYDVLFDGVAANADLRFRMNTSQHPSIVSGGTTLWIGSEWSNIRFYDSTDDTVGGTAYTQVGYLTGVNGYGHIASGTGHFQLNAQATVAKGCNATYKGMMYTDTTGVGALCFCNTTAWEVVAGGGTCG